MLKNIKKLFVYIILLIILIKCFDIVFLNKTVSTSNSSEKNISKYKEFDYGDYSTIKLLHTDTGKIEELPLDIYLYGVVSAEMPASFELEALKAQATVARTYTIYKIRNGSKHLDVRSRYL
jgi:stage II sporulation protein D